MAWKPLLRQIVVSSGPWTVYFIEGLTMGLPTVLLPQLRQANQTISDEAASWLTSSLKYTAIPWVFILSAFMICCGRKKTHLLVCISGLIGSTILFFSNNITHVFVGIISHGAVPAAPLITNVAVLTEYISPNYRGIFLTVKSATLFWGIFVSNAIGTFFHWKNIPKLSIVCAIYSLISIIIWPESPIWLASKGKFEDCATAYRWLKGESEESEKELKTLLQSYENRMLVQQKLSLRSVLTIFRKKQFLKPTLLVILLVCIHACSGKLVSMVYALDVLKKFTSVESNAYYGMLILDGVTVLSMYFGCCLTTVLKRRVMFLGFTSAGIIFLILIVGYLLLGKSGIINENIYVSLVLLAGYSISIGCGPMILCSSIAGELLPLESRVFTMCVVSLVTYIVYGSYFKIAPLCFKHLTMPGTFALFAGMLTLGLCLIYFYLPETKGKTLQEIDNLMKGNEEKSMEEGTTLIRRTRIM